MSDICGSKQGMSTDSSGQSWLFFHGMFVVAVLSATLRYTVAWINYKDYFPLKERSPLLCISLMAVLTVELLLYPVQVLANYFLSGDEPAEVFRVLHCGLKTMGSFIYVLRSLRINYAYRLDDNMRSHKVFRLFKHENYLVLTVLLLAVLRLVPAIAHPEGYPSPVGTSTENGTIFFVRSLVEEVVWQFILIACLWMQKNVRMEFGLIPEIGSILAVSLVTTLLEIATAAAYYGRGMALREVVSAFQCFEGDWPINQIIVMLTCVVMYVASIVYPLSKMREEHELLPIQQVYDLENNLRSFLLEPQYFRIFYNFLKRLEAQESLSEARKRAPYTTLLNIWAKITKFKLQEDTDSSELVDFLRELDGSVFFAKNVVTNLNESFQLLNDELEVVERERVRNSINMALEELEDNVIGQLSVVYKDRFRKTHAFKFLKEAMQQNDRINTNLLMLNMILREHS